MTSHRIQHVAWMALGLLLAWPTEVVAEERFSISIGNNVGNTQEVALKWAADDAERFHEVVNQLGGVSPDRQILLVNQDVKDIQLAFARLQGRVEESQRNGNRTMLFVFYSGHADEKNLHIQGTNLALAEFKKLLAQIPATTSIVVLDACHSTGLVRGRERGMSRAPGFDISYQRETGPEGRVFITSSGIDEVAQESDDLQSGFFSHHLISGLRGGADRDGNGQITLGEVYNYVYHKTLISSHGTSASVQHPELDTQLSGEGEIVLSQLDRSQATLIVPVEVAGNLLVIDSHSNQAVAEVDKAPGQKLSVALRPGRYQIQLRQGNTMLMSEIAFLWSSQQVLRTEDMRVSPLLSVLKKGSTHEMRLWELSAGIGVGKPTTTLGSVLPVGWVSVQRNLTPRWTTRLHLRVGNSVDSNSLWHFSNWETEVGLSAGVKYERSVFSIIGWVVGSGILVNQNAERLDAERIKKLFPNTVTFKTAQNLGGAVGLEAELRILLSDNWYIGLLGGGRVSTIQEEGGRVVGLQVSALLTSGFIFE